MWRNGTISCERNKQTNMARPKIITRIPETEQDSRVYIGDLTLNAIKAATAIGESILSSYYGHEPLGMGSEKVVYHRLDRGDQAIAFFQNRWGDEDGISIEELKKKYYAVKLMHVLIPEHIPDAHFMGSDPPRFHFDIVKAQSLGEAAQREAYKVVACKTRALNVFIDPKTSNFLVDNEGVPKYVDDFGMPSDTSKIYEAIEAIDDPNMRKRAERFAMKAGLSSSANIA